MYTQTQFISHIYFEFPQMVDQPNAYSCHLTFRIWGGLPVYLLGKMAATDVWTE